MRFTFAFGVMCVVLVSTVYAIDDDSTVFSLDESEVVLLGGESGNGIYKSVKNVKAGAKAKKPPTAAECADRKSVV